MIQFFTDFTLDGPYLGQMQTLVAARLPHIPSVNLMADAPSQNPEAAAYLLAALVQYMPRNAITVAVVDPGVGSERQAVMVKADERWFVGPDNGLLDVVCLQASRVERWQIDWRPEQLSNSFHGRDLFTPVAIELACGAIPDSSLYPFTETYLPIDRVKIVYIDGFGNLFTGLRGSQIEAQQHIYCNGVKILHANTFANVQPGELFWYVNSIGLVEIAANRGRASGILSAQIGTPIKIG